MVNRHNPQNIQVFDKCIFQQLTCQVSLATYSEHTESNGIDKARCINDAFAFQNGYDDLRKSQVSNDISYDIPMLHVKCQSFSVF